jgi:acetylornithine deacetylase/succinyl-diaminopimelate desuccinylase-like protein
MNLQAKYAVNEESRFHMGQIEWAKGILANPSVTWPNGRNSHEAANQVIEESEDALIDHIQVQVTG